MMKKKTNFSFSGEGEGLYFIFGPSRAELTMQVEWGAYDRKKKKKERKKIFSSNIFCSL